MATPVFCCGFECGVLGSTDIGQHWRTAGTSTPTISTSTFRSGARSIRFNPTAQTSRLLLTTSGGTLSSNKWIGRFYVRFATLPNTTCDLFFNGEDGVFFNASDNKIYAGYDVSGITLGATGVSVTTGQWYRIDFKIDSSTSPHLTDVQVDGVACGQASSVSGGASFNSVIFGVSRATTTGDIFFDDVLISFTLADYPLGAGNVDHFVATSDGTHTSTSTNIVKGTVAAPTGGGAITSATTDAFNWVNGVPLLGGATDNTRLINQQTASSAQYVEVKLGPASGISTPTAGPRAVEVITADRQASTATCDFITKLNDNGTENSIIARGVVAGSTTDRYARKHYATAPTGGAWTVAAGAGNFNNLKARFGYSSDATPDVYWRGIMVEAEFAVIGTNSTLTADAGSYALSGVDASFAWTRLGKKYIYSQAVNRAANY